MLGCLFACVRAATHTQNKTQTKTTITKRRTHVDRRGQRLGDLDQALDDEVGPARGERRVVGELGRRRAQQAQEQRERGVAVGGLEDFQHQHVERLFLLLLLRFVGFAGFFVDGWVFVAGFAWLLAARTS